MRYIACHPIFATQTLTAVLKSGLSSVLYRDHRSNSRLLLDFSEDIPADLRVAHTR